jgi:hypothetical protein
MGATLLRAKVLEVVLPNTGKQDFSSTRSMFVAVTLFLVASAFVLSIELGARSALQRQTS